MLTCEQMNDLLRKRQVSKLAADVEKTPGLIEYMATTTAEGVLVLRECVNPEAVAEWAQQLLERQKADMLAALERALDDVCGESR